MSLNGEVDNTEARLEFSRRRHHKNGLSERERAREKHLCGELFSSECAFEIHIVNE